MNIDSVKRQSFGSRFLPTAQDKVLADRLKERRLIMAPHSEWTLPLEPTWTENPFGDDNWQFQFHSLRWLDPLRRQALSGDEKSRQLWIHYVRSWLQTNLPGASPTKWAWIDMGDALRTYVLTFALPMFTETPQWLTDSLETHAAWLADEKHLGHGNHALHQLQALFVVAKALSNSSYERLAVQRLGSLAAKSYDAQGINDEGSIAYQEANFHWWNEALRRLEIEGLPLPESAQRITLAPESLAHATQPDGKYVRIGDMDSGGPGKINSPFTRYASTAGAEGTAPQDLIKIYDRGYVYGRSGWGETERDFQQETFFSLCFGAQQKIHGQADGGSVTYFASGRPWLIDTGKYTYGRHPMRSYVVNRQGHNLLIVKDRNYDRSTNVTLFRNNESARHFEAMTRDTGYDDVLMTRRIIHSKRGEYLLIIDAVSAETDVEVEQRWHISHTADVTFSSNTALLSEADASCNMQWIGRSGSLGEVRGETSPLNGWTSLGWRKNAPTTVLTATQTGSQMTFQTVVGAQRATAATTRRVAAGFTEYCIQGRTGVEYVLVGKRGSAVADLPFPDEGLEALLTHSVERETQPTQDGASLLAKLSIGESGIRERGQLLKQGAAEVAKSAQSQAHHNGMTATLIDVAGTDLVLSKELKSAAARRRPLLSWDAKNPIHDRSGQIASYSSRVDASADIAHQGIQSYRVGSLTLPVLSFPGVGSTLHVSFHGALNRGKYSLPRFERSQSLVDLGIPQLIFADPTLDLDPDLNLAWYLGTADHDLHAEIASFIKERQRILGITKVVLSGSSGGGFAALQVAAFIPNSTVVAFNPQTDVLAYHPRLAQQALDVIFPAAKLGSPAISPRLNVMHRYAALGSTVRVNFVQNTGDKFHDTNHRSVFLRDTASLANIHTQTVFEDWGAGHRSPGIETFRRHLHGAGIPRLHAEGANA